ASLAPRDRSDLPVCRGQRGLSTFRGPRPFREGRDHARMKGCGAIAFATSQKSRPFWTCIFLMPIGEGRLSSLNRSLQGSGAALKRGAVSKTSGGVPPCIAGSLLVKAALFLFSVNNVERIEDSFDARVSG